MSEMTASEREIDTYRIGEVERRTMRTPAPQAPLVKKVLIADDDPVFCRSAARILKQAGFDAAMVSDGAQATEALMNEPFAVVLADVMMPGCSGVDLLRIVKTYQLGVPVVLVTGDPQVDTAIEAMELGALQYLKKPVSDQQLRQAVERAYRLRQIDEAKSEAVKQRERNDRDRAGVATAFEQALHTLWIAYQPIVDVSKGRVFAYEALLRSECPSLMNPPALLAAAEQLGRLEELGRHARAAAARGFVRAPKDVLLFVNLHARELVDTELASTDSPLGRMADKVVLEITERSSLEEVSNVVSRVGVLRYLGFRVAIDNLGSGYAGLTSFARFEPDFVKLDPWLISDVAQSGACWKVVQTITSLCSDMQMSVVAGGVERVEVRDCLSELGLSLMQGYLFGKPGAQLT